MKKEMMQCLLWLANKQWMITKSQRDSSILKSFEISASFFLDMRHEEIQDAKFKKIEADETLRKAAENLLSHIQNH